jgi:D-beta-D-heptose 7-phosphate kinase/D-beta-D-heptose 1-phosphate adenosyltransferase
VYLAGMVGDDSRGEILQALLRKKGILCEGIFTDKHRPTTQKTRVIAHHQQVVRIDREVTRPIPENVLKDITNYIADCMPQVDALIIEDYGKGVIVPKLVQEAVRLAKKYKKVITVDPKETHFSYYRGVTAITPNHHEAGSAVGVQIKDSATLERAGEKLLEKLHCENVLITLGENGMCLFEKGKPMFKINTVAQDVFDVSGAGDTVISAFTLAKARKASSQEAAYISNCAAGIVVGKVGVASTNRDELIAKIKQLTEKK